MLLLQFIAIVYLLVQRDDGGVVRTVIVLVFPFSKLIDRYYQRTIIVTRGMVVFIEHLSNMRRRFYG